MIDKTEGWLCSLLWRVVRVVIWSSAKAFTQVRILYSPLDIVGRLGNPFGLISQISRFDSWSRNNMVIMV